MWLWFIIALVLSFGATLLVRRMSVHFGVLDHPSAAPERKLHTRPTPLLGGIAVYGTFLVVLLLVLIFQPHLLFGGYLLPKHLAGIVLAGLLLMIGGWRDDRRSRTPREQLVWPVLAVLVVVGSGIGVSFITNPLGHAFRLDAWSTTVFFIADKPYRIVWLADAFAFVWLMGSMYATKLLDGLDGLVSGVTVLGMFILAALSLMAKVGQPETALLALIVAGAFLGFLLLNFHPAKIFLGEGGSLLAGFFLGTFAILSGGKIATALLILGIPMIDIMVVIVLRLLQARSPFVGGDKRHIHHRLLSLGLSHRQTVILLYVCTAVFGSATLMTTGKAKLVVLGLIFVFMIVFAGTVVVRSRQRSQA